MKLRLLLLAVLIAISVGFTVPAAPAAAQPAPPEDSNAICGSSGFFPEVIGEGFICFVGDFDIILQCPGSEEVAVGDILSCFNFVETGETFDCLVLAVFPVDGEQILFANCTPADGPPDGGNGGGGNGGGGNGGGGQQGGGGVEITQEGEQEAESGEIDQTFDVS